jgi:hypothetical protein
MNDMPRVFAPQLPSRFDTATRPWVPSVNIQPAAHRWLEEHGFGGQIGRASWRELLFSTVEI